jgi:hypothetical protein
LPKILLGGEMSEEDYDEEYGSNEANHYKFIIDNFEKIQLLDKKSWKNKCFESLGRIKKEEKYLFFKMKQPIEEQLKYYSKNEKNMEELDEILAILNPENSFYEYHSIMQALAEVEYGERNGADLEYLIIVDNETTGFFAFPKDVLKEMKSKNEKEISESNERCGGMFL